jgi:flagellar biosynthetic protein FliP
MLANIFSSPLSASLAALAAVLALIWLGRRMAPRLLRLSGVPPGGDGLALEQSLALDARRRLHLVRCAGRRVLLLTGGTQDVVVGWMEQKYPAPACPAAVAQREAAERGLAAGLAGTARRLAPVLLIALLLPAAAGAQSLSIDLGSAAGAGAGAASRLVQLTALLTVLSLAPSLLVMLTAFTRIVIVLSLLRSALGVQSTPPNTVLIGLALFLTLFVMQPVLDQAWSAGLLPMTEGRVETMEGLRLAAAPFHRFMTTNVKAEDLRLFLDLAKLPDPAGPDAAPWRALVPAFLVGELRRGFEMGFLLYLPFLVIDTVVASVLMSLGMMMLPPNVVSLPFKLIFFVLVDGWRLTCGSLVQSFAPPA